MFKHARRNYFIFLFMVLVCTGLGFFLIVLPSADQTQETNVVRKIAKVSAKMDQIERMVLESSMDIKMVMDHVDFLRQGDLGNKSGLGSMPNIQHLRPDSLVPAFKLVKKPRSQVSMVLGIPTVKREHQSYLVETLNSLLNNLQEEEAASAVIIVFVAETDLDFVTSVSNNIMDTFPEHIESGLIEVISPPPHFYPDWSTLRQTLGDQPERVQWRSKQNLDYAFLMMYSHLKGHFYIQLEDDIVAKNGYLTVMHDFALDLIAKQKPWFVIDFCSLGFIGKMFKSSDLPKLSLFFLFFFNDQPGDWLLVHIIRTMVCKLDDSDKKCRKKESDLRISHLPSLFQHIGAHSSLRGKQQNLEIYQDKSFGKVDTFVEHHNPKASVSSTIQHYKFHAINQAYNGKTFFWELIQTLETLWSFVSCHQSD